MVKFLLLFKKLFGGIITIIAKVFRFSFRLLFYRLLTKLYFLGFRFRKNWLEKQTADDISRRTWAYFFVFLISVLVVGSNVTASSRDKSLVNRLPKTIMSNMVRSEFDAATDEELITEIYTSNTLLSAGKEKYFDTIHLLKKQGGLNMGNEDDESPALLSLNVDNDVLIKPNLINLNVSNDGSPAARTEIIKYVVQNGDTVSSIARRFGLSVNTILWANNLTAYSLIRPGNELTILPTSGILYTVKSNDTIAKIAKRYGVEEEKISSANRLGGTLKIGQVLILPGAKKISDSAPAATKVASKNYSGLSVIKDLINKGPKSSGGGNMLWPTVGHRITQYYSWRHTGLDIANKVGTPLYAAEAGTVEFAGWSNGYGYNVVVNHGGGKKTRYAHASKLFVSVGDEVERGENIAAMGSTGWSTGPHIHFEVIINGSKYNPLNYIK